ncbi:hypothetical protein RhiirA4_429563 [Rhizophagus irregularis]|uniref:Uncharacterized protein n=1 Tax=Rhizophagus irregularis TaxID=588596 RepID=A0A2I1HH90_9GLOM|nr:hypothetical protein RhiirA4_429563 [Rhizophagus irregularis]
MVERIEEFARPGDEQFFEAAGSPTGFMASYSEVINVYNKMNSEFSDRIKDTNGNSEGSKGKGKVIEPVNEELNGNKKRVVIAQGNKRGRDTAFKQFITPLMQDINTMIWRERAEKIKQWERLQGGIAPVP